MADGQNECPGKFPFKYEPQWEGPLPGPSFEKQTEDALNGLYCRITKIGGAVPSDDPPKAPGTAEPGTSTLYSRGDHRHPEQVDVVGNSGTTTKLREPRSITLTGDVQGEAWFDGSANITIPTTAQTGTTVFPSDELPQAPGTASPGISDEYSRGDHVHPLQESALTEVVLTAQARHTVTVTAWRFVPDGMSSGSGTWEIVYTNTIAGEPGGTPLVSGLPLIPADAHFTPPDSGRYDISVSGAAQESHFYRGREWIDAAIQDGDHGLFAANFEYPTWQRLGSVTGWFDKSGDDYTISIVCDLPAELALSQTNGRGTETTPAQGLSPLPVAVGGTGLTASPSLLVDLESGTAADVFAESPSPGVTGVLPVANGGTGSATQNFVDLGTGQSIAGPKVFAQGPYGTASAVSAARIDLSTGTVFTKTISAATTFTFAGAPAGAAATFSLILTNGGAYNVTWPVSVKWEDGLAPDLTASGVDLLTFITPDGGATWYGVLSVGDAR